MASRTSSRLRRPLQPMPASVEQALRARGLMRAYRARPQYQQNDYLAWIARAVRSETRQRRLEQMLDELASGDRYMKMAYLAGAPDKARDLPSPRRSVRRVDEGQGASDKVVCRTPTAGKQPTRIAKATFDLLRERIVKVVPASRKGIPFADLPRLVEARLSPAERKRIGSIPWFVTTVKLELEVRGEIQRIEGESPQRLRRCGRRG